MNLNEPGEGNGSRSCGSWRLATIALICLRRAMVACRLQELPLGLSIFRFSSSAPRCRLDVYRVALELSAGVEGFVRSMPDGNADLKDQTLRAARGTVRAIAEGAGRYAPKDKAYRYTIAQGECSECGSMLDDALLAGLIAFELHQHLSYLADRVGAMLTRLIQSQAARLEWTCPGSGRTSPSVRRRGSVP